MKDEQTQISLTEQAPEWKIKLAYFRAEHKVQIKRLSIFLLFFLDLIVVFLFGSILLNYQTGIISDETYMAQLPANLINQNVIKQNFRPKDLIVEDVKLIPAGGNKYDLLAVVRNDNKEWEITELEYTFRVGGEVLEPRKTFVLPKSKKYLMYFNAKKTGKAELVIIDKKWRRIKDYSLLSYKDKIKTEKAFYTPNRSTKLSGQIKITIFNDTPYGFWEVGLPIILYNKNAKPIAIDYVAINKLSSKEEREVEMSLFEPIRETVSRVEVYPEINLLDKNSIMKLSDEHSSPPGLE